MTNHYMIVIIKIKHVSPEVPKAPVIGYLDRLFGKIHDYGNILIGPLAPMKLRLLSGMDIRAQCQQYEDNIYPYRIHGQDR